MLSRITSKQVFISHVVKDYIQTGIYISYSQGVHPNRYIFCFSYAPILLFIIGKIRLIGATLEEVEVAIDAEVACSHIGVR